MILPEPQRVLPVTLHPEILRRVIAGRVRVIHLAERRAAHLRPGDMLWLREPLFIPHQRAGGDMLRVVYGGDGVAADIRWPRVIARPSPGNRLPALAMPVHASRLTLVAQRVTPMRLQQISEDSAVAAGVDIEAGGFGNPLSVCRDGQVFASAAEAFGHMYDAALGPEALGAAAWTCNPEVVEVEFRAIMRNIAQLVPGLGSGGVR